MTNNSRNLAKMSISIRKFTFFMAVCTLVISILLLVATYRANSGYQEMRNTTVNYIQWEREAYALQTASDYLTEQVRCFVETGSREYLDNYFEEAEVTRRRDHAVDSIHAILGESEGFQALQAALSESRALMERECYAMRLTAEATHQDLSALPEALQQVTLSDADQALNADKKSVLARSMVFDQYYHESKAAIMSHMQACIEGIVREIEAQQDTVMNHLSVLLDRQRMLIIASIVITLFTMAVTRLLVISPLLRAVVYIRADQPIPIKGSDEFQFLARTYNLMYEANREQKEQLAYDATHDHLTGVYNRAGYDFFLKNTDWATSALVLFDVDKFKPVNDTYGHEAGDRVLTRVADTLKHSFRSQDYVCRIGGDEFAVIMVHTGNVSSALIREKVERINEALNRELDGMPAIHVSSGVAFGTSNINVDVLFRNADAALYRVKHAGGHGCDICEK